MADTFLFFVSQMWLMRLFFDEPKVVHALTLFWMPVGRVSVGGGTADVEIAFRQLYKRMLKMGRLVRWWFSQLVRCESGVSSVWVVLSYGYPTVIYRLSYGFSCWNAGAKVIHFDGICKRFCEIFWLIEWFLWWFVADLVILLYLCGVLWDEWLILRLVLFYILSLILALILAAFRKTSEH